MIIKRWTEFLILEKVHIIVVEIYVFLFYLGSNLEDFGLHIWSRGDHFLMALANLDGSFTGTIYIDHKGGPDSFEQLQNYKNIEAFFNK